MPRLRLLLGAVGIAAMAYGIVRILADAKDTKPLALGKWLVGTLLVHDLVIAPVVIGVGWLVSRALPNRAARYVQGALITGGLISSVGVFLIWRQGKSSASSLALLHRDYRANLLLLLAIVAVAYLVAYLVDVARTSRTADQPVARTSRTADQPVARTSRTNSRPPADQ